ncbi:MAG: hypothetical protein HUJ68_13430 [Clostridia bacterium]|nr:hypothetical protein [Clostridia bacterium]
MIKDFFSKLNFINTPQCAVKSSFFKIKNKYKILENFSCRNSFFFKDEILLCCYNFYAYYDDIYLITFENEKKEEKKITIDSCNLNTGRDEAVVIAELQSYEKYFERID